MDSAGYGRVVISKSVSISAPDGLYAGVAAPGGNGIHVQQAGVAVYLRGLTVVGNKTIDNRGVWVQSGSRVVIDRCRILSFDSGVYITGSDSPTVIVQDTVMDGNTTGISSFESAIGSLRGSVITGGDCGLCSNNAGKWTARDSLIMKQAVSGIRSATAECGTILVGCTLSSNATAILPEAGTITAVGSAIIDNHVGLGSGSGQLISGGKNIVTGNTTNGTFTATATPLSTEPL